jgi:predicted nucleotidyltransferase
MHQAEHPEVAALLTTLRDSIHAILGERLVGLYLYGSLVTGDFDRNVSDVDLLAVTAGDLDGREFDALHHMHDALAADYPAWRDRVEVAYLAAEALRTFRERPSRIAVISPGEPFHFKEAGKDWLINWWIILSRGVALHGPPPERVIGPIGDEEFRRAVYEQTVEWQEWIEQMRRRGQQAYAILTMCRALYAFENRAQVSKLLAARWACERYPAWAPLIERALAWRQTLDETGVDHEATFPETVGFVRFTLAQMERREPPDGL